MITDKEMTPEEAQVILKVHGITPHDNDYLNISDASMLKFVGTGYLKDITSESLRDVALYAIQKSSEKVAWSGGPRQKDVIDYIRETLNIRASHIRIRKALGELVDEDLVQRNDVTKKTVLYNLNDKGLARYQEISQREFPLVRRQ